MFSVHGLDPNATLAGVPAGELLLQRNVRSPWVHYLESGRLALGLVQAGQLVEQIGVQEGPGWVDVSCAVLDLPCLLDARAETPLQLYRVQRSDFRRVLDGLDVPVRALVMDLARAHRQQSEFAINRLSLDAQARCAQWLLAHAQAADAGRLTIELQQRKRSIATQLGIAPETFSRVMRQLRQRCLISGTGRVLCVDDASGLRALAGV